MTFPDCPALGMQMMREGQGKFRLLSSWGAALVQLPCTIQSSTTQHQICKGQWAASSNSGSQGGIFQDESWVQSRRGRQSNPQTCGFWKQVDTEAGKGLLDSWGSMVQWGLVLTDLLPSLASSRTWYEEDKIQTNWGPKVHADSPI